MRNGETITHTSFSLKLFVWYIITKTVRFYNYIQFSQASITRNTTLVKTSWPEFQISPRVEGMSESHSKISLHRFLPFPLSIDTNHLIANDFYRFRFSSIGYSGIQLHPELHRLYFERAAGVNREKLGAYKPEEDFKPGFEKIRFADFFKRIY